MPGHGLNDGLGLANRRCEFKARPRMVLSQFFEQQRHIALQMPTASDEHRHDQNAFPAFSDQGFGTCAQIGFDELEKGQLDTQLGRLFAHCRTDAAHRFGPFRVTCAMGEKDQSGSWHTCTVTHHDTRDTDQ